MTRKYVCSKCYEEFLAIEDIVNHLKNAHPEVEDIDIDSYIDVIDLDSREWSDIEQRRIRLEPIKTEPSVPREYLPEGWIREEVKEYPYKPYYIYKDAYYCSEHNYVAKDENEFLVHLLAYHPKDFEVVLKHMVKQSLQKKITEDITKKQLETLVYQEIRDWLNKVEEKELIALQRHVESYFEDLLSYLEGTTDLCPICQKVAVIDNKLYLDKITQCLIKGALSTPKYKKLLEDFKAKHGYYPYLGGEYYKCTWNNKEVLMKLHSILHVFLDHSTTFQRLVENKVLDGDLVQFLHQKKYLKKQKEQYIPKAQESGEKLSKGIIIKRKVNLSKGEQALIEWLKKGTVSKE
jgi:hypothetical protein